MSDFNLAELSTRTLEAVRDAHGRALSKCRTWTGDVHRDAISDVNSILFIRQGKRLVDIRPLDEQIRKPNPWQSLQHQRREGRASE